MKKKIVIVISGLAVLVVVAIASFKVEHKYHTGTGFQAYERSILGVVIEPISERDYLECNEWKKNNR